MNASTELVRIDGKRVAYAVVAAENGTPERGWWGIGLAVENEPGYYPVKNYGPYAANADARAVVDALNKRLDLTEREAALIVASSMRGPGRRKRA